MNQENETSVWTAMLLLTRSVVVMATAAEFALMEKGYKGNERQVLMITMVILKLEKVYITPLTYKQSLYNPL